jgi:hypothetical protein
MIDIDGMEAGEAIQTYELLVTYLEEGCRWVQRWRTWQGDEDDRRGWADGDAPGLQLLPTFEDQGFSSPDTLRGRLVVAVDLVIDEPDVRKAAAYWRAIKRVFYPSTRSDRQTIQRAIQAAAGGSPATGLVLFGGFGTTSTESKLLIARGRLAVDVHERLEDE